MGEFILVNVEVVRWIQNFIKSNSLEKYFRDAGFPVDVNAFIEKQLQTTFPEQNSSGIMYWIANNYSYFITGDPVAVTESINNFLLFDPKIISVFGYSIPIYSDPAHLRTYALYAGGAVILFLLLRKRNR